MRRPTFLRVYSSDATGKDDDRRGRARRGLRPALVADPGASTRRETGAHGGPRLAGLGGRPKASLQATRKISGAPRVDK